MRVALFEDERIIKTRFVLYLLEYYLVFFYFIFSVGRRGWKATCKGLCGGAGLWPLETITLHSTCSECETNKFLTHVAPRDTPDELFPPDNFSVKQVSSPKAEDGTSGLIAKYNIYLLSSDKIHKISTEYKILKIMREYENNI